MLDRAAGTALEVLVPRLLPPADAQRIADAIVTLATAITFRLLLAAQQASNPADRRALQTAMTNASEISSGAGADPAYGW